MFQVHFYFGDMRNAWFHLVECNIQPDVAHQHLNQTRNGIKTSEEIKSIDIIIPINERGNSSSTLRMIHRQWYNKIQFQLCKFWWSGFESWYQQVFLAETHQIKNYKSANNIRISENLNVKIRLRFILSGRWWVIFTLAPPLVALIVYLLVKKVLLNAWGSIYFRWLKITILR